MNKKLLRDLEVGEIFQISGLPKYRVVGKQSNLVSFVDTMGHPASVAESSPAWNTTVKVHV